MIDSNLSSSGQLNSHIKDDTGSTYDHIVGSVMRIRIIQKINAQIALCIILTMTNQGQWETVARVVFNYISDKHFT